MALLFFFVRIKTKRSTIHEIMSSQINPYIFIPQDQLSWFFNWLFNPKEQQTFIPPSRLFTLSLWLVVDKVKSIWVAGSLLSLRTVIRDPSRCALWVRCSLALNRFFWIDLLLTLHSAAANSLRIRPPVPERQRKMTACSDFQLFGVRY